MNSDIIVRVVWEGKTYDLDIEHDIPLRLDVSAVENGDIGNFFGVGSQAFELPGTKKNNRFFKHGYEIGTEGIPAFYNSIQGYIIYNGETLLEGQFQLLEVVADSNGFVTYKCQLTDSVVQFKDLLSSKLVKDADWSEYTHTLSNDNITVSWDGDLLSGSVYYPLADYGREDTDVYPIVPRLQLGTDMGAIGSTQSPLQLKQFLPAIRVKDSLDVIFKQVDFRYTGSFTETEDFQNMYVLSKPKEGLGVVTSNETTADFDAGSNVNQVVPVGQNYVVSASVEFQDDSDSYDTTLSRYTIPETGDYTFQGQVQFFNPIQNTWPDQAFIQLYLVIDTDGNPNNAIVLNEDVVRVDQSTGIGPYYLNVEYTDAFAVGVNLRLQGYITQAGGSNPLNTTFISTGTQFKAINTPVTYEGATVDMALQWNPQMKSIDFVKGLVNQFNLVMTPKYGENNVIEIEQFDDWIRKGRGKDWTEKYETAERIGINHTVNEQQRELLLKNVDDNDRFSKLSQENEPNFQYGTLRLLSDNNVSQGTKKIGDFFAPVVLGGSLVPFETGSDGTPTFNVDFNSTMVLPHLYKYDNNKQKSFSFKPRLGYKVTNTLPSGSIINIGNTSAYNTISGSYSTLSNLSSLPAVGEGNYDLHFSNDYANFSYTNLGWDNGTTSFERYWKTYLDSLYWEGSRKLTLDLQFNSYEYKDIRLNDIIFIKNQRYRINKISGFNITADDVVTVELIRLYPAYYNNQQILDCTFDAGYENLDPFPTPTPTATAIPPTPTPTYAPAPIQSASYDIEYYELTLNADGTASVTFECVPTNEEVTYVVSGSSGFDLQFTTLQSYTPTVTSSISTTLNSAGTDTLNLQWDMSKLQTWDAAGQVGKIGLKTYIDPTTCDWKCIDTVEFNPPNITVISGSMVGSYGLGSFTRYDDGTSTCYNPSITPTPTPTSVANVFYTVIEGGESSGGTATYLNQFGSPVTESLSTNERIFVGAVSGSVSVTGVGSGIFTSTTPFGTTFTPSTDCREYKFQNNALIYPNTDSVAFYVPCNSSTLTYSFIQPGGAFDEVCISYTGSAEMIGGIGTITDLGAC